MKLDPIISALRERCPSFHQRVGGAAQWAGLERAENAPVPFAYVAPLREDAGAQESNNGYYQVITNTFGVIVVVPNCADERGQDAGRWLEVLRPEIFRAILSWHMKPKDEFSEIVYEGGVLIYIDAARAAYQFEFSFETYIDTCRRSMAWMSMWTALIRRCRKISRMAGSKDISRWIYEYFFQYHSERHSSAAFLC